jgi:hypothetical protein
MFVFQEEYKNLTVSLFLFIFFNLCFILLTEWTLAILGRKVTGRPVSEEMTHNNECLESLTVCVGEQFASKC